MAYRFRRSTCSRATASGIIISGAVSSQTPGDFGNMGERPTHPELLDWLADEFVRSGWSSKQMHRLIMNSQTHRQGSELRADAGKAGPFIRLFWRLPRSVWRRKSFGIPRCRSRESAVKAYFRPCRTEC